MYIYYKIIFSFFIFNRMFSCLLRKNSKVLRLSMNNNHIDRQNILNVKSQHMFSEEEVERFLDENEFIKNKKLISISPGGFKGFYMLGVCKFIKENYDLNDYIFSGASAGAWNSLLLCFNRDIGEIQQNVLDNTLLRANKLGHVENLLKQKMIESYTTTDS